MRIEIFYHMYCKADYIRRFNKTYNKIVESGLIDKINNIHVVYVGGKCDPEIKKYKVRLIKGDTYAMGGEMNTLRYLWDFCQDRECKLLYLHSKGVTKASNKNVDDWVDYMEYFLIEKHEKCLELLENYDTCGVNMRPSPMLHYAGNFWWATSKYIKTKDRFDHLKNSTYEINTGRSVERFYCELWLLDSQQRNPVSLFKSPSWSYYETPYPREEYENVESPLLFPKN